MHDIYELRMVLPSFSIIHNSSSPKRVLIKKLLKPVKFELYCSLYLYISSVNKTFPCPIWNNKFFQLNQNVRNSLQLSLPDFLVYCGEKLTEMLLTIAIRIMVFSLLPRSNVYELSSLTKVIKHCWHALTLKIMFDLFTGCMP